MIQIDKQLIDGLFAKAEASERRRMNYDLRTSAEDGSQRMLNALLPGTVVPIHRHPNSNENVILLCGKLVEVIYSLTPSPSPNGEGSLVEVERIMLDPSVGNFGCVVPKGAWHTVEVLEPSVIYETKDGKYGEDGSTTLTTSSSETFGTITKTITKTEIPTKNHAENMKGELCDGRSLSSKSTENLTENPDQQCTFSNSLGDLKKNIEYLIGMERHSGSMEVITPLYVSRMLNVPLEEVEEAMREIGIS